jgi:transcriptional regulator of heat shock response
MENQNTTAELSERELRDALKALSMNLFGASSRYQKLRERVVPVTKTVVKDDGTSVEEVVIQNGARLMTTKVSTDLELLSELQNIIKQRDEYLANLAQKQAESKAAQIVSQEASGSAI